MYSILSRRFNLSDIRFAALMLLSVVLVACGGGGDNPAVPSYTVGGTVTGLTGTGLVLQDGAGHNLAISADGAFVFPAIAKGRTYAVAVNTSPVNPVQVCTVNNGSGTIASANVTNVSVVCASTSNAHTVGGTVSGLTGTGLVLQNNAGDDLAVSADGAFTFTTPVASGATYTVAVLTQPSGPPQTCVVTNPAGTITTADVTNVTVACATNAYAVKATVSGLAGSGLVLQNNGADNLNGANGTLTFATPVVSGGAYAVTVLTQPTGPSQSCVVTSGSGTIAGADVTATVVCTTIFTIGGTISGLTGSGLVLQNNGGDNLSVAALANSFTFATPVASGSAYAVTVLTQPGTPTQHCVVTSGSGTASGNVTNVDIVCRTTGSLVFVTNPFDGANGSITAFVIDPITGALSAPANTPVTDTHPVGIVVDATGGFAYVANQDSANVTPYTIAADGSLTALLTGGATSATTSPATLVQNPLGTHLYVGSDRTASAGIVDAFAITVAGTTVVPIADIGNTPYVTGNTPFGMVVDPTDTWLFATNQFDATITSFPIDTSGTLTPLPAVSTPFHAGDPTNNPLGIAVHPSAASPLLFVTDNTAGKLSVYAYDGSGILTEAAGSPYNVGAAPRGVTVDPTGQFVYVANSNSNSVSAFKITNAATGALAAVAGSPFVVGGAAQIPTALQVETSGQFLYVVNDAGSVSAFKINLTTGVLALVAGSPVVTAGAGGLGTSSLAIH